MPDEMHEDDLGQEAEQVESEASEDLGGEDTAGVEPDYFDWSEYGDRRVRVQVQGEEVEAPLSEVVSGYMRQADYTQKTQQLGFARAIQEAMDHDPRSALEMLAQHYQLPVAWQQEQEEEDEFLDPVEREVRELRQVTASLQEARAFDQLQRDVEAMRAKYGDDFDPQEVVAVANGRGWYGRRGLEDAFRVIHAEKQFAQRAAAGQQVARQTAASQQKLEAKREAQVISGGEGASRGVIEGQPPARTFKEAWAAAKQQLGIDDPSTLL